MGACCGLRFCSASYFSTVTYLTPISPTGSWAATRALLRGVKMGIREGVEYVLSVRRV